MSENASWQHRPVPLAHGHTAPRDHGPATLVISGGRPGVGATTVAVQLAASLAQDAHRIVLVDADLYGADVAAYCNLAGGLGIGEVLSGRKTIHEVLQRGPAGMQVLAGAASAETRGSLSERAIQRVLKQMRTLAPHADCLLVDAGNQPSDFTARMWSAADRLLLVTSPDAVAVMDSYALVKTLLTRQSLRRPVLLVVNQVAGEATAADVHRRIDQSCRRFLGLAVEFAGWLPHERVIARGEISESLASSFARLAKHVLDSQQAPHPQRIAA
jgi:flagellar biosynthesis protein FlhG